MFFWQVWINFSNQKHSRKGLCILRISKLEKFILFKKHRKQRKTEANKPEILILGAWVSQIPVFGMFLYGALQKYLSAFSRFR